MTQRFTATLETGSGGGAFVTIPFDVESVWGTRGRVKVRATIDGRPYRGSVTPMGGRHVLGILKAIREELGKSTGDPVEIVLERDLEERTVEVPPDFLEALATQPQAAAFFEGLAFTYRKEYVRWINDAKRPETRARRLAKALDKLENGEKL